MTDRYVMYYVLSLKLIHSRLVYFVLSFWQGGVQFIEEDKYECRSSKMRCTSLPLNISVS